MKFPFVIAENNGGSRIVAVGVTKKDKLIIGQILTPLNVMFPPRLVDSIVRQSNGYVEWRKTNKKFNAKQEVPFLIKADRYDETVSGLTKEIEDGIHAWLYPQV